MFGHSFFIAALTACSLILAAPAGQAQSAQSLKKSEEKIREEMIVISRQLGVTCTECHNVQNFRDAEKKSYKTGLEHMKLTQMLRDKGMNGHDNKPEASCYMCHHGKLRPDYKEPIAEAGAASKH